MAATQSGNEISKFNFEEAITEVTELLKVADFVAVDATIETSGFIFQDENFNPEYMREINSAFGEWFDNVKLHEEGRCLLEVGVAIFKRVPDKPYELEAECFHIPLLPACVDDNELTRFRGTSCVRLKFDGYAVEWMQQVNFDVNRPFYIGAPYMNRQLRELADKYMKENPEFMVAPRKRRLNPQLMPTLYAMVGEEERKIILNRLKGVSKIFEAISTSRIPVVGHHLLLKLIFIFKDFFEFLPDTFPESIAKVRSTFPLVYDTKQMAKILRSFPTVPVRYQNRLQDNRLYELLRNLNYGCDIGSKFTTTVGGRSRVYKEDAEDMCMGDLLEEDPQSYCYVAGFDALVTGLVFLDMISVIQKANVDCQLEADSDDEEEESSESDGCLDCLDMFIKGVPTLFVNRIYGEPSVPPAYCEFFLRSTEEKKQLRRNIELELKNLVKKKQIDISKYIVRDWPAPSTEPRHIPG